MSRRRYRWDDGVAHLRERCNHLAAFIDDFGSRRLPIRREGTLFQALCRAIAYQQLSGKAAATIHGRFVELFPDSSPNPDAVLQMGPSRLRSVGLSQAKSLAMMDLARHVADGLLPGPRQMGRMSDEEIIESLVRVRGVGPWTAQMYLIFNIGRPDVMPASDLGVQKGVGYVYGLGALPTPADVMKHTQKFAPYRSVAAWYFWRASEWPGYVSA